MTEPFVRAESRHGFVQELEARDHHWLADKSREAGGDGLGPTPGELLLGSFAAWTAIGVLDLAREKEWAVDSVEVSITQPASRPVAGTWDASAPLVRELRVRGELNEAERRELEADVAQRWPRGSWLPPGDLEDRFAYG